MSLRGYTVPRVRVDNVSLQLVDRAEALVVDESFNDDYSFDGRQRMSDNDGRTYTYSANVSHLPCASGTDNSKPDAPSAVGLLRLPRVRIRDMTFVAGGLTPGDMASAFGVAATSLRSMTLFTSVYKSSEGVALRVGQRQVDLDDSAAYVAVSGRRMWLVVDRDSKSFPIRLRAFGRPSEGSRSRNTSDV